MKTSDVQLPLHQASSGRELLRSNIRFFVGWRPHLVGSFLFALGLLPAFRVLMVLMWDHTGSLLVAMLMHVSLIASNIIFGATATPGMTGPALVFALTGAMWVIVGLSAVASREHFPQHSLLR